MVNYGSWRSISDMSLDERLTAAAVIVRDAIEKFDYEVELSRVSCRDDSTHAMTSDSR